MADHNTENTGKTKSGAKKIVIAAIAAAVIILIAAGIVVGKKIIEPMKAYNAAVALMDAGKYGDAIDAFKALDGYKDSTEKITLCETGILDNEYAAALALMDEGMFAEAIAAFEKLDYKDSAEKIEECKTAITDSKYNEALALMSTGQYKEAGDILKALEYKDSAEKFEECRAAAPYDLTEIGDIITFGKFEQDYDFENGAEPISWRVLDKQDGKVLIITEKALEKMPFFAIYWKRSYIGAYLDSAFLYDFTPEEKAMIVETTVTADKHPDYIGTDQGSDTINKLFLLSVEEAEKYFEDDADRVCYATPYLEHVSAKEYAIHAGSCVEADMTCDWWLRTACMNRGTAVIANIDPSGGINMSTHGCRLALRPACWIQMEG